MESIKETPYFLIDENVLDRYYDMLESTLKENWNNYQIGYSFKTNSLPWLVKYVKNRGAYAEVVSHDEYLLAKYLGYKDNEIIYNGPYKSSDSFENVLKSGGYVNVDSVREIAWIKELAEEKGMCINIGIRVNFDLEKLCPGETTMGEVSGRFGICYENGDLIKVINELYKCHNIRIKGLHLHSSTKSRSVEVFRQIARMACKIKKETGVDFEYIDIGGGYCGGMPGRPEYSEYFPAIAEELSKAFTVEKTKLIVEPGISLISKCTIFVTSIFDVRQIRGQRYIMTDGSRFNIDPTMIKTTYMYHINYIDDYKVRLKLPEQTITGFSCMEADRIFSMCDDYELVPGDRIVYENVGGYTMSLNPLFIQYFPAVYVKRNNEICKVRRKWEPRDYVAGSVCEQIKQ